MNADTRSSVSVNRKAALLSAAGVLGSALLWLVSFKAVAYWMGPAGVGLFSQLRQMAQAATVGATFGGTNSVVQGLAQRQAEAERRQFRGTAFRLIGTTGFGLALAMALGAAPLTKFILSSDSPELIGTVRWMAVAVLFNVAGTYAIAVLNGYRAYAYLAVAQVAGPMSLVILLVGTWWTSLPADPLLLAEAFVLCYGVTGVVGVFGVSRLPKFAVTKARVTFLSGVESREFLRFALSNLVAALSSTVALLLIRAWVIDARGLASAGLFDAAWTLTFNYTTLFLTACSAIYLPLLTAAVRLEDQKSCIGKTAYLVLGVSVLICNGMVLWNELLLDLLYSRQFEASGPILTVLVVAVVLRGVSWVYGTLILATRDSRMLLVSDLALNLSLLVTARFALDRFDSLEALGWAFVVPHFLYLVFVIEYAQIKNSLMRRRQIWPLVMAAALPLAYLALTSAGSQWEYSEPSRSLCMAIGMAVGGTALVKYWKISL